MINSLSKILAAVLAVLLLYAVPAVQQAQRQENVLLLSTYHTLTEFVDSVRNKGYITPVMYSEFSSKLSAEGGTFDIAMEHEHKKYVPEYSDPADPLTFQHAYSIHYDGHYTDEVESTLFPDNADGKESMSRRYLLQAGDYFKVSLKRQGVSSLNVWSRMLYRSAEGQTDWPLQYGGMVHNEDY